MEVIKEYCNKLGIKINEKKTKIVPIKKGFRFLKVKFTLTETGKVLRKANKESAKRMRKKFKSFRKWIIEETFTYKDAQQSYNSWKGHMKRCNSYKILKKMDKEFKNMFDEFLNVVA